MRTAASPVVSGRCGEPDGGLGEGDEAGQRFDAGKPGVHFGIAREIDVPFRRTRDVTIERDVGYGWFLSTGDPVVAFQFCINNSKDIVRAADHFIRAEGCTENCD